MSKKSSPVDSNKTAERFPQEGKNEVRKEVRREVRKMEAGGKRLRKKAPPIF